MKAILTVVGEDRIGIIAEISALLSKNKINILDVEQTIFDNNFSMMMNVLIPEEVHFLEIKEALKNKGKEINLQVDLFNSEIFKQMHRI